MKKNTLIVILFLILILSFVYYYFLMKKINTDLNSKIYILQTQIDKKNKSLDLQSSKIQKFIDDKALLINSVGKYNNNKIKLLANSMDLAIIKKDNAIRNNLLDSINNRNINNKEVKILIKLSFKSKLKLCNDISNKEGKLFCKNDLYYASALQKQDESICDNIKNNKHNIEICKKKINILKLVNKY